MTRCAVIKLYYTEYCINLSFLHLFQGRIHQIEYAMEAVKQGSATVGLKNKTHAVLVALKVIITSSPLTVLSLGCYFPLAWHTVRSFIV